jgi:mannose-6-phosphate isomerase-like protein (cupin superfamily)
MKLVILFVMASITGICAAQATTQTTPKAEVFSGQDIATQLATAVQVSKTKGSGGGTVGDYKTHKIMLSVRTSSGGAEVHAHFDDIFVITEGKATLITGGTVIDAKTGPDGETKGTRIADGNTQTIAKNDIVHIPAGTPHQLIITPGDVFKTVVVKVREE